MSQPSISSAISKLEDVFGVQLFVRHHAQGLTLTRAGKQLYAEATRLLHDAGHLSATARDIGGSLTGQIQIGCFQTFGPFFMPALLTGFKERFPGIEVHISEGHHLDLVPALKSGIFDVLLLWDYDLDPLLNPEVLVEAQPYVLLPRGDPLARSASISLHDLAERPMVLLDIPPSNSYFCSIFEDIGITPKIGYRTASLEMLRGLVGNGCGFSTLVTRPAGDQTYDGKPLACLPIREGVRPSRIVVARVDKVWTVQVVDRFISYCREYFLSIDSSIGYYPPGATQDSTARGGAGTDTFSAPSGKRPRRRSSRSVSAAPSQ